MRISILEFKLLWSNLGFLQACILFIFDECKIIWYLGNRVLFSSIVFKWSCTKIKEISTCSIPSATFSLVTLFGDIWLINEQICLIVAFVYILQVTCKIEHDLIFVTQNYLENWLPNFCNEFFSFFPIFLIISAC